MFVTRVRHNDEGTESDDVICTLCYVIGLLVVERESWRGNSVETIAVTDVAVEFRNDVLFAQQIFVLKCETSRALLEFISKKACKYSAIVHFFCKIRHFKGR